MDVDAGIDDSVAMHRLIGNERTRGWEKVRYFPRWSFEIDATREFFADLEQRIVGPIAKPIQNATIEERGWRCSAIFQTVGARIHRKYNVQIFHYLSSEPFV